MGAGAANTSSGITVGQFHNNDLYNNDLYSSPPFEIALQPGEKMTIYLGWLPTISAIVRRTANPIKLAAMIRKSLVSMPSI